MSDALQERLQVSDTGGIKWGVDLTYADKENGIISNLNVNNPGGKIGFGTFVDGKTPDGTTFRQWMWFENGIPAKNKCGEINLTLRQNPLTNRYCIEVEEDIVYLSPTETKIISRTKRSSVDSPDPAVKRPAVSVGYVYLNTRRIGGPPVEVFYNEKNWSSQLFKEGKLIDVFEYVQQSYDGPGKTAFMMALQHMDFEMYEQIAIQIRKPALVDPRD